MEINQRSRSLTSQRGALMIEVLVAIVIGVIGLWGLMEMQLRLEKSEMESYQRTQAVILVNDMASRITTNRQNPFIAGSAYLTKATIASPTGVDVSNCAAGNSTPATFDQADVTEWCEALKGAAETLSASKVGSMIGGRGCVEALGSRQFLITVAWQGFTPISAPPTEVACGKDDYDIPGTDCVADLCRRYVTTRIRIATL
jgi:type IV pilus assembly protein PilV